ncbi:hypothetical protein CHELA40_14920 [Chelatococcus asaccharovorans]|nr:hypothetical protein CHELA17_60702 [Chelatococcus asaccharovorans]CAH1680767.1 hypothetical protein CHELA40_14920 [Chelatococcus asaccharovorans]
MRIARVFVGAFAPTTSAGTFNRGEDNLGWQNVTVQNVTATETKSLDRALYRERPPCDRLSDKESRPPRD